jgi:hypothetical protein
MAPELPRLRSAAARQVQSRQQILNQQADKEMVLLVRM